jgi:Arc/MetJ-type ribon-helix-helix transcriptional regulator
VATRKLYSVWLDPDLLDGLKRLKEREGDSESDTIRAALRAWLDQHAALKAAPRRVRPRRRA